MTLKSPQSHVIATPDIQTPRLELIAITLEMMHAGLARSLDFAQLVDAEVPADWPPAEWDHQAFEYVIDKMMRYPDFHGWGRYIALKLPDRNRRVLIGTCGATLPLELNDDPEIGYGLLPAFQRQRYATEATTAFIAWIFEYPHIRSVNAQTFPHLHGSVRVLMKNGFEFAGSGPGPEEGTVLYRKFRE